jgi:hypothetical protein
MVSLMRSTCQEYEPGAWNFPKMHLAQHLFDDIEEKGVTRNYTSKTFKKMHGAIKESYKQRTNFKDVGGQVGDFYQVVRTSTTESLSDLES